MVGYNFQVIFEAQVRALDKRQTVRAPRKRHARPGEPIQLFCDQRSRRCRKLLSPDPICTRVRMIEIAVSELIGIASIVIEGVPLDREEIELFAIADGFAPQCLNLAKAGLWRETARDHMGDFWLARHGIGRFEGVIIQWEPA